MRTSSGTGTALTRDPLRGAPIHRPCQSLTNITVPPGADASNSNANGGTAGTGLLDVRGLSLGGFGVEIQFDVTLAPVIANGTIVYNQSQFVYNGIAIGFSDDPYTNDVADPTIDGDEDPTPIAIESAPAFAIQKVSSYIDGDPNVPLSMDRNDPLIGFDQITRAAVKHIAIR